MIDILHVERNKVDVSSHVISSLLLFSVPCNLLNSLHNIGFYIDVTHARLLYREINTWVCLWLCFRCSVLNFLCNNGLIIRIRD